MPVTEMPAAARSLTIVPAGRRQMSHVIMLAHRVWPDAYAGILTPEQIGNMLWRIYTYENLEKETADGHRFWVAYAGEKPVGFASAYREGDVIWLKKLYVDPAVQGQRVGTKLMHQTVSAFLPAAEIRLLAMPHNVAAHRFYERRGFTRIGERPVRMGDWEFNDFLFSMPLIDKN